MLRTLTRANFTLSISPSHKNGIFKCTDKRCKICRLYLQECSNFKLSNGKNWEVRSHITCNAKNVIYFLTCNFCNYTTYIGITTGDEFVGFKQRMNVHIHECRTGESTCNFPKHVYVCSKQKGKKEEPFFTIKIMMKIHNPELLEVYEKMFHAKGYDTMNSQYNNL